MELDQTKVSPETHVCVGTFRPLRSEFHKIFLESANSDCPTCPREHKHYRSSAYAIGPMPGLWNCYDAGCYDTGVYRTVEEVIRIREGAHE